MTRASPDIRSARRAGGAVLISGNCLAQHDGIREDAGLNTTTLYRYRLRAVDVDGNYGGYSGIVSVSAQAFW